VGAPREGAVYVFAGPHRASPIPLASGAASTVLRAPTPAHGFGGALEVRDTDRDGLLDVLVGAPDGDGSVHLFRGRREGLDPTPAWILAAPHAGERFGASLGVGDLDGDGWPELVVGSPRATAAGEVHLRRAGSAGERPGLVRVYRGGPEAFRTQEPWLELVGSDSDEGFGSALALADFDRDGLDDLVVGAPRRGQGLGAIALLRGRSELGPLDLPELETRLGADEGELLGAALAAGDVNGDGNSDLLVGAPGHAGDGRAELFAGPLSGQWTMLDADARLDSVPGSAGAFGQEVALVDVDGDGRADMVVSAPELAGTGRVYVFGGRAVLEHRQADQHDGTLSGEHPGHELGGAAASDH
jgi:hypothetical protein